MIKNYPTAIGIKIAFEVPVRMYRKECKEICKECKEKPSDLCGLLSALYYTK